MDYATLSYKPWSIAMIFIGNTFFEWELAHKLKGTLRQAFEYKPLALQLQFLPLLYARAEDVVAVSDLPSDEYLRAMEGLRGNLPKIICIDDKVPEGEQEVVSWGASDIINAWAAARSLKYKMPSCCVARAINSKLWSFERSPKLPGATVVSAAKALHDALDGKAGKWVLKTSQGFSGSGHCVFDVNEIQRAQLFFEKEFAVGDPLILEPWVERKVDFSSQWNISPTGEKVLVGVTKFYNTASGRYLGTEINPSEKVFSGTGCFVDAHLDFCKIIILDIARAGYYGPVGFDAMVYVCPQTGQERLQPLVEINARMTMSAAVLLFHHNYQTATSGHYYLRPVDNKGIGLLPTYLNCRNGKKVLFKYQLFIES